MKINKEEAGNLAKWLIQKGHSKLCPICSETDWSVGTQAIDLKTISEVSYKVLLVSCNNCSYIQLYDFNKLKKKEAFK